jgi:hypothetical protein
MCGTRIGELPGDDETSSSLSSSSSSSLVLSRMLDLWFESALPFLFLLRVDRDCRRVVVVMAVAAVGLRPRRSAGALDHDASPS